MRLNVTVMHTHVRTLPGRAASPDQNACSSARATRSMVTCTTVLCVAYSYAIL